MNLGKPLRSISGALEASAGHGLPAEPGRWYVLFGGRQRPLLVPMGDYQLQKQLLPVFVGNRAKALYARALLKLHSLMPRVNLLPEWSMPGYPVGDLLGRVPAAARAAIQIGTTGPYQKASALLISESGKSLALAKIALAPSADPLVRAEAQWLRDLEGVPEVSGQVPRLLAEGDTGDGRRYLVTSLAPSARATTAFTAAHGRFLARLAGARSETAAFAASPCCVFLEQALAEVGPGLQRAEAAQLGAALAACRRALSGFSGPFVLSQGDFAPWNIRLHGGGIFVFDWEYARYGGNPLADVLHYHLMPRAAPGRAIGRWFFAAVLARAWSFAQQAHGGRVWREKEITALALAYLLEVLLQYCRANGGRIDHGDRVTHGYWSLMERRATWMAA